jgi:hypothetical protein
MRVRTLIALVPLLFVGLASGTAAADTPPTFPILPDQFFVGVVNGQTTAATVKTACPGPVRGNGHPISGQTLSVSRVSAPTDATVGYTGSLANSIKASPQTSSVANVPVVFTEYFVGKALPTTWIVPCDGNGVIAFVPDPTSPTARTAFVPVRFVNIAW